MNKTNLKIIKLPKLYKYIEGVSRPEYKKFDNWNKLSYSQNGSFKDYRKQYIQNYFLNVGTGESGIFASYGSACGQWFEDNSPNDLLTQNDINVIDKIQKYDTSACESEIVIDLEPFGLEKTCLQGFSDHEYDLDSKRFIEDLKTGNSTNMQAKYGDMEKYFQTRIYAYQRELEGFEIGGCRVIHLGRKGNNIVPGDKNCLRLSGDIDYIATPYQKEDVEKHIREVIVPNCVEISEYLRIYNKIFAQ